MRLWDQYAMINLNGRVLQYPPFGIEFELDISSTVTGTVTLYNPAPATVAASQEDPAALELTAGYRDDYGVVLLGEVQKSTYKPGKDAKLELDVRDAAKKVLRSRIKKSWKGTIQASTVIREVCDIAGVEIGKVELAEDVEFQNLVFAGNSWTFERVLGWCAKATKSRYFYRFGKVNFLESDSGYEDAYVLHRGSGLLNAKPTAKGFEIDALFLYRLGPGTLVKYIDSSDEEHLTKLKKGKLKFQPQGGSKSELEVVKI